MLATKPLVHWVAHRGDCEHHMENTLNSIKAAIANGITHIEIDVQLTKDELPVAFHDDDLKRMFAINDALGNTLFSTIKQRPLRIGEHKVMHAAAYYVPTLLQVVELIKQHPSVTLYVEVKNINFTYFSYQHVYHTLMLCLQPILPQVVFIGFSYRFLRYVKCFSHLPIAYVLPSWQHYSAKMLANLQPDIIFTNHNLIPEHETFHTKKETWVVYEVSTVDQAKELLKKGIHTFESFTPALLKAQM